MKHSLNDILGSLSKDPSQPSFLRNRLTMATTFHEGNQPNDQSIQHISSPLQSPGSFLQDQNSYYALHSTMNSTKQHSFYSRNTSSQIHFYSKKNNDQKPLKDKSHHKQQQSPTFQTQDTQVDPNQTVSFLLPFIPQKAGLLNETWNSHALQSPNSGSTVSTFYPQNKKGFSKQIGNISKSKLQVKEKEHISPNQSRKNYFSERSPPSSLVLGSSSLQSKQLFNNTNSFQQFKPNPTQSQFEQSYYISPQGSNKNNNNYSLISKDNISYLHETDKSLDCFPQSNRTTSKLKLPSKFNKNTMSCADFKVPIGQLDSKNEISKVSNFQQNSLIRPIRRRKEPISLETMAKEMTSLSITSISSLLAADQDLNSSTIINLRNKEQAVIQKLTDIVKCCQEIAEDAFMFLDKLKDSHSKTKDLYGVFQKIHSKAVFCSSTSLTLQSKYIHAKLAEMCADLDISERIWKEFLRISNEHLVFQFKIFGYKNLAIISLKRGRSQKSFIYLQKLLKYAWLYNKKELETQVYEKISRVFYYRNEMEQALFFHERALNYETEPLDSNIRRIGVHVARFDQDQKRNKGRDATLSEDDFDLAIFHTNSDTPKEKEEKNISDDTSQSRENHLQQSLKKHRLDHYQLDPSITSLDGMKALALVKNRMSEPLGPVCPVSRYRNNSYVNLQGSVGFATQKSTLVPKFFISQKKNMIKVIDKVHLSHLSGNRSVESLLNLGNFYDQDNHELLSNDCIRRREVLPAMNRLIQIFLSNLRVFHEETVAKLQNLQHI